MQQLMLLSNAPCIPAALFFFLLASERPGLEIKIHATVLSAVLKHTEAQPLVEDA